MAAFRGFDPHGEVRVYYHGRLPHWRQERCTYFVTFRLADSLPTTVTQELEEERNLLLRRSGFDPEDSNWRVKLGGSSGLVREEFFKRYGAFYDSCLDRGLGDCLLNDLELAGMVKGSFGYWHSRGVRMDGVVVMPNHVHALVTPTKNDELGDVMASIKGFTSRAISKEMGNAGQVWQKESYDRIVRDDAHLSQCRDYIRVNPVKAGISSEGRVFYC